VGVYKAIERDPVKGVIAGRGFSPCRVLERWRDADREMLKLSSRLSRTLGRGSVGAAHVIEPCPGPFTNRAEFPPTRTFSPVPVDRPTATAHAQELAARWIQSAHCFHRRGPRDESGRESDDTKHSR